MNWLLIPSMVILAASCGQNSTKKTETGSDSLSTTTTSDVTDNPAGTNTNTTATGTITVPEPLQVSFRQKYPDVRDVRWSRHEPISTFDWDWTGWPVMDTADYMARFNYNGADYWAWYDNEYNWVGSVTNLKDFAGLPAAVSKVVNSKYPGYTIDAVDQEVDKNRTAYEIDLSKGADKATILVDEQGNIMKKKELTDGQKTKEKNL